MIDKIMNYNKTLWIGVAILVCSVGTGARSQAGENDMTQPDAPLEPMEEGYLGLKNPRQTAIGTKDNEVTWSCIEFGSYPANEVVNSTFKAGSIAMISNVQDILVLRHIITPISESYGNKKDIITPLA